MAGPMYHLVTAEGTRPVFLAIVTSAGVDLGHPAASLTVHGAYLVPQPLPGVLSLHGASVASAGTLSPLSPLSLHGASVLGVASAEPQHS